MAKYKFRLLEGQHEDQVPTGKKNQQGDMICVQHRYRKGEIIDTDTDLAHMFNPPGSTPKFERIIDDARAYEPSNPLSRQPGETDAQFSARMTTLANAAKAAAEKPMPVDAQRRATYEAMTLEELRSHAESEEIQLGEAETKEEILAVILEQEACALS